MTHLSIFSGIGGFDIAAEWAGFETVGQCEIDDFACRVLEKHWPGIPRWRDIRTLTKEGFHEKTGLWTVDVLSGGFPCTPFSCAGKRKGAADDRYLWPEMLRIIRELRPTWVVGENVVGFVSMGLDDALSDLENEGYSARTFIIPACAVEAPHERKRVFIVGYADHNGSSAPKIAGGASAPGGNQQERQNAPGKSQGAGIPRNNENVADACCSERRENPAPCRGMAREFCVSQREEGSGRPCTCDQDVADTDIAGLQRHKQPEPHREWDRKERERASGAACECRPLGDANGAWLDWRVALSLPAGLPGFADGGERSAEPGLGGGFDGFPCWLYDIGGLSSGAKTRADEVLRDLRKTDAEKTIQWEAGRFFGVSEAEVLLAFLCEYEEASGGGYLPSEGEAFLEKCLRGLWHTIEASRSSHRRRYNQQFAREYSNALHLLSRGTSSLMPKAWADGCWEDGIPRIASGVKNRVQRLKCLGNAVVPQQVYPIFSAISAITAGAEEVKNNA